MSRLFQELRRRNVFRVAALYAVVAWLIMQIVSVMTPALELPDWVDGFFAVALLVGFPIALVLAWAFEMTPDGVKLSGVITPNDGIAAQTGRKLDYVIIGGLALVGVMIVADRMAPENTITPAGDGAPVVASDDIAIASIAVLPFADMSADGDQKYLGDGLAEELLNALAPIEGLRVTSRTSAFAFRDTGMSISDIADALAVNHVLEGSVRKAGTTLRVTAQLIDTKTDAHLWSKSFDRELTAENILEIQDEIAGKIVAELTNKMNLPASASASRITSVEAYELYLRGLELMRKTEPEPLKKAIESYKQALAIDPAYAPAYAGLVEAYQMSGFYSGMPRAETARNMKSSSDRGLALAPGRPETLTAAGMHAQFELRLEDALLLFDRAIEVGPNYAAAHRHRAGALSDLGRFTEALTAYEEALVYDPVSPDILGNMTRLRLSTGDFDGALESAGANIKWNGDTAQALNMMSALVRYQGDYAGAHRLLLKAAKINPDEYNVQADLASLYLDIGLGDLALEAARLPGTKAMTLAAMGETAAAMELARSDPDDYDSAYAAYLAADYAFAYETFRKEVTAYDLTGESAIGLEEPLWIAEYAFVLRQNDDPDAELLIKKLEQYLSAKASADAKITDEILGAAAVRIMRDDLEGALQWLDRVIDKGHAFLTLTRQPVFAPLMDHPGYAARLARMEENAARHRAAIEKQLTSN